MAQDRFDTLMSQPNYNAEGTLLAGLPFSREVGMRMHLTQDGLAILSIAYDPRFVGDPSTGILHGGVITALLDTACGAAVASRQERRGQIATLDLRIDYMRPATPGETVVARAECFRMTRNVGFARATAYHDAPDSPIAIATGAFILGQRAAEDRK